MTADKDALLREDEIELAYWRFDARRKGYSDWKGAPQSERDAFKAELRARITAALAEKGDGWVKCSGKDGAARNATFIDSELLGKYNICTERNGVWYARSPLPPLPKGE